MNENNLSEKAIINNCLLPVPQGIQASLEVVSFHKPLNSFKLFHPFSPLFNSCVFFLVYVHNIQKVALGIA